MNDSLNKAPVHLCLLRWTFRSESTGSGLSEEDVYIFGQHLHSNSLFPLQKTDTDGRTQDKMELVRQLGANFSLKRMERPCSMN